MKKYTPWKLTKEKKEYILEKVYPNHALYTDLDTGVRECFTFHELGMIEAIEENRRKAARKGGSIRV